MVPDALTDGPRFAAFCQRYVRHTKGRWAGQPLDLEDWQREFWNEALELDPVTGLRVYSEVGLGIPRKNGKSVQASAAGLYFLVADNEAEPEVYVAAAAKQQAGIVLGQSRRTALQSPRLRHYLAVSKYLIECPRNGGIMRALSADAALQQGLSPSANIIDELEAHRTADLYTALTSGTGAREQPFTLWIATAGSEGGILTDVLAQMDTGEGESEVRGSLRIHRDRAAGVLIYWYGTPEGADIHDPAVWRDVNPASWLQDGRSLERTYRRMLARGALVDWRTYHLNQFVTHGEPWMQPEAWDACAGDVTLLPTLPVHVAIRIAHGHRIAAVVAAQRQGDRVVVRSRILANDEGHISAREVEDHLRALHGTLPATVQAAVRFRAGGPETIRSRPGPEFMHAGAFFASSAQRLAADGLVMVDVPSTPQRITPAAETLMQLVTTRHLVHDGSAVLARHIGNVVARPVAQGYAVEAADPGPGGDPRPIVAAQAVMLAVHRAMTAPPPPSRAIHLPRPR
jgi:phage terminase large subunit-like protein